MYNIEKPDVHKRRIDYSDQEMMTEEYFQNLPKSERKKLEGTVQLTQEEIDVAYHYAELACQKYCNIFATYDIDRKSVIQETLLKVHRFRYAFRGDSEWSTYTYRVAGNTILNCISAAKRKGDARAAKEEYVENWDEGESHPPSFYTEIASVACTEPLEDVVSREEQVEKFYEMVEDLEEGMRDVILMLLQGESYRYIADTMGIPLGSAQSRIHRAKEILTEIRDGYIDVD